MLAAGSTEASAQVASTAAAQPIAATTAYQTATATPTGNMLTRAVVNSVTPAANGTISMPAPAKSVTINLPAPGPGLSLAQLVETQKVGQPLDEQANCLATAVYFEARGESVEGQLAVARVVMNRAGSGKYPPDWCSVMKQPWQFSFVNPRTGQYPAVDTGCAAWARAQGVARLAIANVVPSLDSDVLWYHANYVAPSWGRRLNMVERIGAHIFYRA